MHNDNRCTVKVRTVVTAGLLHRYDTGNEGFLPQNVTGDETWIQHSSPNPRGNRWNGATRHLHVRRNSRVHSQQEKTFVQSFGMIKELFLWTSCLGRQQWFYQYAETLRSSHDLLRRSSSSRKKNVRSMAPSWQLQTTHKCLHHLHHHKIRMDSVAAPCLYSWSRIMRLFLWFFERQPARAPWWGWRGTAEHGAPGAAGEGEQLFTGHDYLPMFKRGRRLQRWLLCRTEKWMCCQHRCSEVVRSKAIGSSRLYFLTNPRIKGRPVRNL